MLKSTGIVRKIDELGRIVLPVELRRSLGISERDALEIYVDGSSIVLKRSAPAVCSAMAPGTSAPSGGGTSAASACGSCGRIRTCRRPLRVRPRQDRRSTGRRIDSPACFFAGNLEKRVSSSRENAYNGVGSSSAGESPSIPRSPRDAALC